MLDYMIYVYGFIMAGIDVIALPLMKATHLGLLKSTWTFPISMIIYSLQPLIFYKSLAIENMVVMNILWDVMSDMIVTLVGLFLFGETLNYTQTIGLILSSIGIILLGMH